MSGEHGLDRFKPRRLLGEAGLLLLTALLIAGAAWAVRTPRLPLATDATAYSMNIEFPLVGPAAAIAIHSADTHYFVDTRPEAGGGHVPGSFSVRQDEFDDDVMALRDFLLPEDPLILYGDGDLLALAAVAARLNRGPVKWSLIWKNEVDPDHVLPHLQVLTVGGRTDRKLGDAAELMAELAVQYQKEYSSSSDQPDGFALALQAHVADDLGAAWRGQAVRRRLSAGKQAQSKRCGPLTPPASVRRCRRTGAC